MHSPVDEHDQILRQPQGLVPVVRDEQRRRIERGEELRQFVEQARVGAFVEPRERLIEQHERRPQAQRTREADPSSFAAGQMIGAPVEQVRDAEQLGGFLDARAPSPLSSTPRSRSPSSRFSRTDCRRNTCSWKTNATGRLDGRDRRCRRSGPRPARGRSRPAIRRSSVVLPDPFGPRIAVVRPPRSAKRRNVQNEPAVALDAHAIELDVHQAR